MTEISKAWVWSQYRGIADNGAQPLPLLGNATADSDSLRSRRLKGGSSLAGAMLIGLFFPKIAFLLLVFAVLLVLSGLEPQRFEDALKQAPGGSLILKILAVLDLLL